MTKNKFPIILLLIALVQYSCVKNRDFDVPEVACENTLKATSSYEEIKAMYVDHTIKIQADLSIEGYVISSDVAGNFFGVLYFQNKASNATGGFEIAIDLRDSHLFYKSGAKIIIKLKGLYLGYSKGVYKLGGVFTSFGNESVGRLPSNTVFEHIFVVCDNGSELLPQEISLDQISAATVNTLVTIKGVQFSEEDLNNTFAIAKEETARTLVDCKDQKLTIVNSGYSDFQNEAIPEGSGTVTGILSKENDGYFIVIRDLEDVTLDEERCVAEVTVFTSNYLFFSEIADPNNNVGARFVELFNGGITPLSLKGWSIVRYTNSNTEPSSTLMLEGTIQVQQTLVISPNAEEFLAVYGFAPDVAIKGNSVADSNGDDNLVLVDPFGKVIDVFGVIGEDGSGTNHEFEDGKALRTFEITNGNPIFTPSEWVIYNDTGASGTLKQPQNAPEDFAPAQR